jgi:hypothetical protein
LRTGEASATFALSVSSTGLKYRDANRKEYRAMETKTQFIERLSWLLDESITLPNGYKIGLDGFIGLIPGIGDFIGGSLSSIIIYKAHQLGVPRMILGRMIIK